MKAGHRGAAGVDAIAAAGVFAPKAPRAGGGGKRWHVNWPCNRLHCASNGWHNSAYIAPVQQEVSPGAGRPSTHHRRLRHRGRPRGRLAASTGSPGRRSPTPDLGHRAHQDRRRPHHRPRRPAALRQLQRAPRPHDLRRHLRREESAFGRERLPQGRAGGGQGARRLDPALAGRQLRVRLQLEGRHRAQGRAPGPPRAGLARHRDQPVRHRRIPALRRAIGTEPYICINLGLGTIDDARHWVEYTNGSQNDLLGRSAPQERPRPPLQREVLGARQRDRRPLAARAQERRGLLEVRARGGQGDARASTPRSSWSRAAPATTAPTGSAGTAPSSRPCATTPTTSPSTPTSATAATTSSASSGSGR